MARIIAETAVVTVYEQQQARKRAEKWYGPWADTVAAIRAARGASESADVTAEERARQRAAEDWAGMQNAYPENPFEVAAAGGFGDAIRRLLFGDPVDSIRRTDCHD